MFTSAASACSALRNALTSEPSWREDRRIQVANENDSDTAYLGLDPHVPRSADALSIPCKQDSLKARENSSLEPGSSLTGSIDYGSQSPVI
jgi:hypothetical protein